MKLTIDLGEDPDGSPDGTASLTVEWPSDTSTWALAADGKSVRMTGLTLHDIEETWADTGDKLRRAKANSDPN